MKTNISTLAGYRCNPEGDGRIYNRICEDGKFKEVMDVLLEFAEKLRLIVWSMTAEGNKPTETVEKETDSTASELTEQPGGPSENYPGICV